MLLRTKYLQIAQFTLLTAGISSDGQDLGCLLKLFTLIAHKLANAQPHFLKAFLDGEMAELLLQIVEQPFPEEGKADIDAAALELLGTIITLQTGE